MISIQLHSKRLVYTTAVAIGLLASAPSRGETIVSTLSETPTNIHVIGGFDFGPGPFRYSAGQTFTAFRDYSDVTGAARLGTLAGASEQNPVDYSFYVAQDNAGTPGAALASATLHVINSSPQVYALNFTNLSLEDGLKYWLVASSDAMQVVIDGSSTGNRGMWDTVYDVQGAGGLFSQMDSGPWTETSHFAIFAMYGTETGDPIANGDPLGVVSAGPEPETYAMLLAGLGVLGFAARRRKEERAG